MQQNELVIFIIIRAHRMHKMRSVATHVAWSICVLTACLSVAHNRELDNSG